MPNALMICFNSKLVRLKDEVNVFPKVARNQVSIPNWFD